MGSDDEWGKLTVSNVPDVAIIDGPGYHMSYGEITKCATEGSVLIATDAPAKAGWGWEYLRPESVSLKVAD